jgi:outer membrane lipoprotein SlyB
VAGTLDSNKPVLDDGAEKPEPKAAPRADKAPARSSPNTATAGKTAPATTVAAAACTTCGVIESVTPFQKKGEGTGIGAVAGGVLGGVVGHQVGGGNGKKAMTVLGAIGGGVAGHEVEKRQRSTTLYAIKVRMQDGSLRNVTQSTAPTVGQKVTVDGSTVKARA